MFVAVAAGNAYGPAATEGLNALAASKYVTAVGAVWDSDAGSVSFASGAIDYSTEPDRIASFSQRHAGLDILAPGADILNLRSPDGLIVRSGTSMAAPLVAGAAVLVREMADAAGYPITPAQIRDLLRETGVWVFDGDDEDDNVPNTYRYYPRLDVFAALSELDGRIRAHSPSDPPSEPPPVTGPDDEDAPTVVTASDDNPPAIIVTPAVSGTVPALSLGNAPQHTPLTDWATRGDALIADGQITLAEHARYLTGASRVYAIPSGAPPLTFVIQRTDLRDNGPDQPPDAFEVALLEAGSQQPLVGPPAQLPHTDALMNIQSDGRVFAAAGVTLTGQYLAPGVLDLNSPITVEVDLSGIPANTQALLSFDLVGFDVTESSVVLEVPEGEPSINSISGAVYLDTNNNGLFDPDEIGLRDVLLTLTGPVERFALTGPDGSYRFDELPDGVYTVTQTQPTGYLDGIDTPGTPLLGTVENDRFVDLDLSGNAQLVNYNFGELPIANSISGFVFVDINNDGVKDANEPGLPGVTITLTGPVTVTVITVADGSYRFDELPDGVYTVSQTQPNGYLDGIDTPGTPLLGTVENDRFVDLGLSGNVQLVNYNFGDLPIANSISGFVYVDLNNDGIKDPDEPGLPGVTITLTGLVEQTVVTAADGLYRFDELPDGVYTVTQTQPAGYLDGIDTPGTPLLGTVENDRFVNLDLSGNVLLFNYNFAEQSIVEANAITGFVYLDLNNDGVKDSDEPGLPGVTITLTGPVTQTGVTAADGSYRFDELPDGVYTVTQTQPTGYLDGIDTPGTPLLGSVENDRFANLDLSGNVHLLDYNFGERPNNVISGFVYVDLNNDGIKDTEEPGVPGVTITLTGPVTQTGVTAADGSYRFDELPDGVYTVTQAQPTGYLDGIDTPGTPLLGSVENDRFVNLDLSGNVHLLDYNFGERFNNSIAGIVYVDVNNNGIREPYELALPNVVISLTGPVQRTTLTGLDGTYRFSSLPDGIYTVIQTQPAEFLDGIDSPGQPRLGRVENDRFVDLNLSGGINATEYDFGERGMLFPDKTQFLASTPAPTPLMLARMVRPEGGEWFSVTAAEDATMMIAAGEGTNAPALELFTETMVPVAHGQQGMLQALVTGGATYLLRMDADGEAVPTIETSPFDATGRRSFHNASHPHDVSGDGFLTPLDPLLIINQLNGRQIIDSQGRFLVYPTTESTLPFFDTSNDGQLTALDALLVINTLNARSVGEGEAQLSDLRQRVDVADVELHEWLFDARNESSLSPTDRSIDDLAIALDDFSNPDWQKRPLPKPSAPAFVDLDDIELSLDEIAADVLHAMGQLQP